ncbi:MAG: hypothetical protein IPH84_06025 [Bacteroidales bacterium]|nr:hypothetical protein [Bacteroidales bacterium]
MNYTAKYQELKSIYSTDLDFSDDDISCKWVRFNSISVDTLSNERKDRIKQAAYSWTLPDEAIRENRSFTYPIFQRKTNSDHSDNPIILLHGLNERSWLKYLVWAFYLAEKTSRPVILFPIAFHMNRSPIPWGSPRAMAPLLESRRERMGTENLSTVANVALSERLSEDPLRFYTSGQQSASDIVQLATQLTNGLHPILPKSRTIDFFAYSIGAFLAQIIMIGNPSLLFSQSRFFLFCGGAFFDQMNGISKLIMDKPAFDRLRKFYINELGDEMLRSPMLHQSLYKTELGQAFQAMLKSDNYSLYRNDSLQRLKDQVYTLALEEDSVIPAYGVKASMGFLKNTHLASFPFAFTHENPFPVYSDPLESAKVNIAFEDVMSKAVSFLQ